MKLFKVEKGSLKIGDIMGGFPSTQTQQIIMFIEMTYKLVLFFFIYRLLSCRPLSFKTWKDVSKGDIKIFLAQLIAMELVKKTSIESYWNHGEIVRTPYFGTYMSQNNFQNILSNFHIVDNSLDVLKNRPGHDPLFCVRPMIGMIERTFQWSYKPGRDLSFNEGCMPFCGRVKFRGYNPSKPTKYHIKLFEVNDARTGYCLGFDVYTGKEYPTRCGTKCVTT